MPAATTLDADRRRRRVVWACAAAGLLAAGLVYADKAGDDRSAFIRWRPQVLQFWRGVNVYETMTFPNPPIMPITLYPLMSLPPLQGAVAWFGLKAALTALSVWFCFTMARLDKNAITSWVQASIILLSARPILGDLQHGNINLLILFLVVACLFAWRDGRDVTAGLILGLAIAYKVTPALFVPYFVYKRSYKTVGATFLGLTLFLVVVPGLIIGPSFNRVCLSTWWQKMVSPYVDKGVVSATEVNQSMAGVAARLLSAAAVETGPDDAQGSVNLFDGSPGAVGLVVKGLSVGIVALLAWLCRTKATGRDDPRLFGEFSLVVLAMLFLSERSWKHHYVTLLLPYTYLMCRAGASGLAGRVRAWVASAVALSAVLMGSTSSEVGGLFAHGQGHKVAQAYGMFFWAGVVLFVATAWRVRAEGRDVGAVATEGREVALAYQGRPLLGT